MSTRANDQKNLLRRKVRSSRKKLSAFEQRKASQKLIRNLLIARVFEKSSHIAIYLSNDGEICPKKLLVYLRKWKKKIFLPVLHPLHPERMVFCEVKPNTRWVRNRFGITEPDIKYSKTIHPRFLSLVLMPLVAFDNTGNRIGMGGGFYDRTFDFKLDTQNKRPILIGLAHDFQKVKRLEKEPWDIPMHSVATDRSYYRFK